MCAKGILLPPSLKLLALSLALSGCAPLQQAPLVYTSSHVVGVKLGVAPTQPESMEAVIGYKDLDAAYAPVAVSNPYLDKAMTSGNKYDKELYEIKEIYGIYGTQASAEGATQLLTKEESADMEAYFQRFSAMNKSKETSITDRKAKESSQALLDLADQLKKDLAANGSCTALVATDELKEGYSNILKCSSGDAQADAANKYSKLQLEAKSYREFATDANAAKIASDNSEGLYQNDLKEFNDIKDRVRGALEKLASIQKRDAISVYGSFDADTGAETAKPQSVTDSSVGDNGVKVKVGKVFSTGVAAQNVSEAQKIAASAVVISACINAVGDQASKVYTDPKDGDARKLYIQALVSECFKYKESK